jgi:hypothetical protein
LDAVNLQQMLLPLQQKKLPQQKLPLKPVPQQAVPALKCQKVAKSPLHLKQKSPAAKPAETSSLVHY